MRCSSQDVGGEVVFDIAPDGVDVVCAVLPVVELNDEVTAVDAVVVGVFLGHRAGPGQVEMVETFLRWMAASFCSAKSVRTCPDVQGHEAEQRLLPETPVMSAAASPCGLEREGDLGAVVGEDVQSGPRRRWWLWPAVRPSRLSMSWKARSSRSPRMRSPCLGPLRTSAGFDPKKNGRDGDDVVGPYTELERDVMSLDAPAPGFLRAGLAEDGEVVELHVTHEGDHAHLFFQWAENVFVLHYLAALFVGARESAPIPAGRRPARAGWRPCPAGRGRGG